MATLDYIEIPSSASQLRPEPRDFRPAPKVITSLPHPSPPSSPSSNPPQTQNGANPLTSPTFSLLPQLLLSSSIPSAPDAKQGRPDSGILMSNKDPLSLPIMTNNFKRFVARVGPIFWLQDRIEEVLFWKKGWKVTFAWMAAYCFLCYFPRLLFILPHITFIAIVVKAHEKPNASQQQAPDESVPWQANIQAIQNLMGFVSDASDTVVPYTVHLSPARSSFAPHILTLLLVTFLPLLILVSLPAFPVRLVCLFGGIIPVLCLHPTARKLWPLVRTWMPNT
ncbi:hypothetical protein BD779DRAFT_1675224 [Infundibulicybe gibba]|nr:hypothetical protein BD779DRAFT_1675224 [Infundibulicybe gibba]